MRKAAAQARLSPAGAGGRHAAELYQQLRQRQAKLMSPGGATQSLPGSVEEFLSQLIGSLDEGRTAALVQDDAAMTTAEGAQMLGVSRQFLIKLLERGEIPYHMVGTHRRIYLRDLLAYKTKRDSRRRKILDDLTRAEAEEGLYDLEPPDDPAE